MSSESIFEIMIGYAADGMELSSEEMIISDFPGCMRGLFGMIDQSLDFLDIRILDKAAELSLSINAAAGGRLDEEEIFDIILLWMGDMMNY